MKSPVISAVTLNVIIAVLKSCGPEPGGKYSTLRKLKQGANPPVMVPGGSASALGNVNDAPAIASAQKLVRRGDRRRFCLIQQFVFIQTSKGTGNQSSGIF